MNDCTLGAVGKKKLCLKRRRMKPFLKKDINE